MEAEEPVAEEPVTVRATPRGGGEVDPAMWIDPSIDPWPSRQPVPANTESSVVRTPVAEGDSPSTGLSQLGAPSAAASSVDPMFTSALSPHSATGTRRRGLGVRAALRTLLRQRRRMLLSVIAVALGVGYLAGSLSLLQRVGAGLAAQSGEATEQADLVVEGSIADDGPFQQNRRLVSDSLVSTLRSTPGIASVEPRLESPSMLIIGLDGQPVVGFGLTERPLGANFPKDPSLNPYRFLGAGRPPDTPTEVVIDQRSAKAAGTKVGDQVLVASKNSVGTYTVTGILDLTDAQLPAGSSLALFETEAARPLFDTGADDNAIAIRLSPGTSRDQVKEAVAAQLYAGAEVSTREEYSQHRQATLGKSFTMIRVLLIGFAGLALIVGAFTVANSMALLFDHRRRGFAMLRLLGASPRQLVGAASIEALIGGFIAGVFGLGLGLLIGWAIERLISSLGTPLPVVGPLLTWWIPLVAVLVGGLVTLATALSPARAAAKTPPVHAVTGVETRPGDRPLGRTILRWTLVFLVIAAIGAGIGFAIGGTEAALIAAGIGGAVAIVLIALPRVLSGVVSLATRLLLGRSVALRRMSALRSRQARTRAASTTAALLLAAAVVSGLTVLSSSFVSSVDDQVTKSITADLVIDSGSFTTGGLSADLIKRLRATEGVAAVTSYRPGLAQVGARNWRAGGLAGSDAFKLLDLDVIGPTPSSFRTDEVLISERLAKEEGLTAGDTVPVIFPAGAVEQMKVRAVFRSRLNVLLGDLIIDTSVMAKQLPTSKDFLALLDLAKDAPPTMRADITRMSTESGAAHVLTPNQLIATRAELLRGFARVIQWMLAFSVVLALIGVANTLQLGINERRREFGLLRAVGATRRQILRLVLAEACALSLVGTAAGMAIGIGAAYGTVRALSEFGLDRFDPPIVTVLLIAAVAIGLGLIGAVIPALRATRIPVLESIADSTGEEPPRGGRRRRRRGPDDDPAGPGNGPDGGPGGPTGTDSPLDSASPAPRLSDLPAATVAHGQTGPAEPDVNSLSSDTEIHMAMRCYSCGNEPGDGPSCLACGATQITPTVHAYAARPVANMTATAAPEPVIQPATIETAAPAAIAAPAPALEQTVAEVAGPSAPTSPPAAPAVDESLFRPRAASAPAVEPEVEPEVVRVAPTPAPAPAAAAIATATLGDLFRRGDVESSQPQPAVPSMAETPTPTPEPSPTPTPAPSAAATAEAPRPSLGSIFDQRPTAADGPGPSPFAQYPTESSRKREEATAAEVTPIIAAPISADAAVATSSAADAELWYRHEAATSPPPPLPAPPVSPTMFQPPAAAAPSSSPSVAVRNPDAPATNSSDPFGLGSAVSRLDRTSALDSSVAFRVAGALLVHPERVRSVVAGRTDGAPTVIVLTQQRAIVVTDRAFVPEIELFELLEGMTVQGRTSDGKASLTLGLRERAVTVGEIVDVEAAVELASIARLGSGASEF